MTLMLVPILVIVVFYALRYYFTRTFNYWKDRNVPYPEPVPFFGNMKDSALRKTSMGVLYHELYNMFPNEKVVGIYRMTTPCLLIRDLDLVKQIMIKDFDQFMDRGWEFSKKGLGQNMFHADGDTWRALRSRFTPLFTSSKLKNMFYLLEERVDNFVDYVNKECRKNPEHEIHTMMQKYTISTIFACAFGIDVNTLSGKMDAFKEIDRLTLTPNYALELDMMYQGILKTLRLPFFSAKVTNVFNDLVKTVIKQRNGKPSDRQDFMDAMLELREAAKISTSKFGEDHELEITIEVMAAQAFVFYVGGYETSATTLTYMLHHIAVNQHVQDKLIEELDKSLVENNGKITYDSLKHMKYLEDVFNETLRLHSVVEPLQRRAKADYKLPGTGITIKKGQMVIVSPRAIHYDEKYWPNPEVFDPERFSPEAADSRHPCAYAPFGVGPRNCIGMRFGQIQSRLCIAKFLSKFRVELGKNTAEKLDVEPNRLIIGPKGDVNLRLVPRN